MDSDAKLIQPAYPIGELGIPWGANEKVQWLAAQKIQRSYSAHVLERLTRIEKALGDYLEVKRYGLLQYSHGDYELCITLAKNWQPNKPAVLVTGGVHGYETSGVHGALLFIETEFARYAEHFNLLVAPCVSPWAYETINRWNPNTDDPNRCFIAGSLCQEAAQLMDYITALDAPIIAHLDLHETTNSDNTEFRPALGARDGVQQDIWDIPDGFYCVGDTLKPEPSWQAAIIAAVQDVTHIAEPDENNRLIGVKIEQNGVINYPKRALGLCAGFTDAPYVCTTEVYPDSPRVNDEVCSAAQVAAITGALQYLLKQRNN